MPDPNRTPSILFVDQSGELGGAELSLFDIARHFTATSKVVLLSEGPFQQRLQDAGVDVEVLPLGAAATIARDSRLLGALSGIPSLSATVLRVARQARSHELLYANTQKAFVVCAFASLLARRPLIWHLRDILTAEHFSATLRRVVVMLANRFAACVIANSQATADAFQRAGGSCPVRVVHNGIDPSRFDAVDRVAAKQALRRALGVPDARLVGVFSRLAEWKGQHVVIEALTQLPDTHAVFVGGSLFGEDAYEARLKQLAMDRSVQARCHFLGFRQDIPVLMAGVDVVAHTSIHPEPFGRVVVEGMLSGNPVVATQGGGVDEIIRPREDGLVVEPGNPAALAAALDYLARSPDRHAAIATAGQHTAHHRFSLDACIAGVRRTVAEVLG